MDGEVVTYPERQLRHQQGFQANDLAHTLFLRQDLSLKLELASWLAILERLASAILLSSLFLSTGITGVYRQSTQLAFSLDADT